jgi:hypothetical protein
VTGNVSVTSPVFHWWVTVGSGLQAYQCHCISLTYYTRPEDMMVGATGMLCTMTVYTRDVSLHPVLVSVIAT